MNPHSKTTRLDKVTWLLDNSHLWDGIPNGDDPAQLSQVAKLMRDEGFYSRTTHLCDIKVENLVVAARKARAAAVQ